MATAGHFRVLYFASASTMTGKEWDDFPAPMSLRDLLVLLEGKYTGINDQVILSSAITKNLEYLDETTDDSLGQESTIFEQGDEVAIIPPVSSG